MAKSDISIATMRNKVTICTSADVTIGGGMFVLTRTRAWDAPALVEPYRGSMFSREGYAVKEGREQQSHRIVIRARYSFEIGSAAWIYEHRKKTPPRWYKVLSVKDVDAPMGPCWELAVRLVEKSDDAMQPRKADDNPVAAGPVMSLPEGVKL